MAERYVEYELDSYDEEKKELAGKLISEPDSYARKLEYYNAYAGRSRESDPGYWDAMREAMDTFAGDYDAERKRFCEVDIFACSLLYGAVPEEYFQFEFEGKNDFGRRQYMCDKERFKLFRPCYDFDQYEKIKNKWLQYNVFQKYMKRVCVLLQKNDDAEYRAFKEFTKKNPLFLFKPIRESCGKGIRRIDTAGADLRELYSDLCEKGGVADEIIRQDERVGVFHPGSVNGVRLIALRSKGKTHIALSPLFRMGVGDGVVDNSSEAIRACVDEKTGYVYTCGFDRNGNRFVEHPDTGVPIIGFKVPEWEQLLELADRIMEELEGFARYIGFDFALTDAGWVLIEVNPFPQTVLQQIASRSGVREKLQTLAV